MTTDDPEFEEDPRERYSAYDKWEYRQIIFKGDQNHLWRNIADSYFFACEPLIGQLAVGRLREDIEGTAAIFLFRHYLELALKQIIFMGRLLTVEDHNLTYAFKREVKEVEKIHTLSTLWDWVVKDAKPHVECWDNYDTDSVEKCIAEFDDVDPKGFAFRYKGQGGEFCRYSFGALWDQMNHFRLVLDGLATYLDQKRDEMAEYEQYLNEEFGNENYE